MIRLRVPVTVALAILVLAMFWAPVAIPYGSDEKTTNHPTTVDGMEATAADIEQRIPPDQTVLTVMSEYYALADRGPPYTPRIYHLTSPQHGQIEGYNRTRRADRIERGLAHRFENGSVGLVIMTQRTHYMIDRWELAEQAFRAYYCRVMPTPDLYQQYGVHIYVYAPNSGDCVTETQWAWDEP